MRRSFFNELFWLAIFAVILFAYFHGLKVGEQHVAEAAARCGSAPLDHEVEKRASIFPRG